VPLRTDDREGAMNRVLRALCLLSALALASSAVGCKKFKKPAAEADAAPTTDPDEGDPETDDDKSDEELSKKVGEYIRNCMNTMSSPIYHSRRVYASWAPKAGLTGRETKIFGIPKVSGAAKCRSAATKAAKMKPDDKPMEEAGEAYAKAVVAAEAIINEASAYYEQKQYKDDKFAKGKELHPKLVAALEEFHKADTAIHKEISEETKPLAKRQLVRIEKEEGKKFRWHRRNVLNVALELVEVGDPGDEEDEVAPDAYDASVDTYEKALTALRDYGSLHRADLSNTKKAKIGASAAFDSFMRAADAYLKESHDYSRCLHGAPAAAKSKDGKVDLDKLPRCPDGGTHEFGQKYDELIITSNANSFPW